MTTDHRLPHPTPPRYEHHLSPTLTDSPAPEARTTGARCTQLRLPNLVAAAPTVSCSDGAMPLATTAFGGGNWRAVDCFRLPMPQLYLSPVDHCSGRAATMPAGARQPSKTSLVIGSPPGCMEGFAEIVDDSDEDDDDDDDDEEEDEDEEEESQGNPTPTNETTASDEFEWVRGSPMLVDLLQQDQECELALRRVRQQKAPQSSVHTDACDSDPKGVISVMPALPPTSSDGHKHDDAAGPQDTDCSSSGGRRSRTARNRRERVPVVRRREDYPVVGGEAGVTSDAHLTKSAAPLLTGAPQQSSCRCCTAGHPAGHRTIGPALSLPPPPPTAVPPLCHHDDGRPCPCNCDDDSYDATTMPRSKTLPCYYRSRTPQPCFRVHSPTLSDWEHPRTRARSQPRVSRRRQHHHAAYEPVHPACSCACPYNHCNRDLALEYMQWRSFFKANGLPPDYEDLQDKVHRLEGDKESLSLQVSVLTEQIEAQTDKIKDLESVLDMKKGQLENVEDMLQHGLMTLESQKLDLMSEISNLKLRLTAIEKEKLEMEERVRKAELEAISLKTSVAERERELVIARSQATVRNPSDGVKPGSLVSPENSLHRNPQRHAEMEKLRKTLECLLSANQEKDRRIDELQDAIKRYKQVQERVLSSHFPNPVSLEDEDGADGSMISPPVTTTPTIKSKLTDGRILDKPPLNVRPTATSTPVHAKGEISSLQGTPSLNLVQNPTVMNVIKTSPSSQRAASSEEIAFTPPKTPPARMRHGIETYGTIPRKHGQLVFGLSSPDSYCSINSPDLGPFHGHPTKSSGLSFGKRFFRLKTDKRSCSAPNLGPTDSGTGSDSVPPSNPGSQMLVSSPGLEGKSKSKGLKRIFGKLKRSNSQHLENAPGEFRRGGIRATAGPRLGWSKELKGDKYIDVPFARWDTEKIASWLHDMGLTAYIGDCKRWVKNGDHLLRANAHDLEKELGMKNPLHRKKLQLALQAIGSEADDKTGALDHNWVMRWLDDVGLPQYKDAFSEARIDGRVLNFLTVEDLFTLRVTNMLHYVSFKRGIQVLRLHHFDPNCLKRRPTSDEPQSGARTSKEVSLWTNHRVMEWLRSVDLSEYAPNLRGSGVHGALLVFEPMFNAELLATLLSIPPSKTLLRRHLSTHFKQLVGSDVVKHKRECEAAPGFIPIMPSMRIKPTRKSQFAIIRKKNKNDLYFEDYVCPLDLSISGDDMNITEEETTSVQVNPAKSKNENGTVATCEIVEVSLEIGHLIVKEMPTECKRHAHDFLCNLS